MSTTTKSKVPSKPDKDTARSIRYGWVEQQVALLKAGRIAEIDAENIAEELSDVGRAEYKELESALRLVLLHLMKWDCQPTHRSKSWVFSIRIQRRHVARVLKENPSLRPRLAEAIGEAYRDARDEAQQETGLPGQVFESVCPYDWSAITTRVVQYDDVRSPDED
jgi:peptidoglycan/xylan/chitin deacetylase (PgdA/CDA1 family)